HLYGSTFGGYLELTAHERRNGISFGKEKGKRQSVLRTWKLTLPHFFLAKEVRFFQGGIGRDGLGMWLMRGHDARLNSTAAGNGTAHAVVCPQASEFGLWNGQGPEGLGGVSE